MAAVLKSASKSLCSKHGFTSQTNIVAIKKSLLLFDADGELTASVGD
jgi:hypothetical protein